MIFWRMDIKKKKNVRKHFSDYIFFLFAFFITIIVESKKHDKWFSNCSLLAKWYHSSSLTVIVHANNPVFKSFEPIIIILNKSKNGRLPSRYVLPFDASNLLTIYRKSNKVWALEYFKRDS